MAKETTGKRPISILVPEALALRLDRYCRSQAGIRKSATWIVAITAWLDRKKAA